MKIKPYNTNEVSSSRRKFSPIRYRKSMNEYSSTINKTRENLLVLINNEFISHLRANSPSKINHKTLADVDKEFDWNRVIQLKAESFSPSDIYIRGEAKTNTYLFNCSLDKSCISNSSEDTERVPEFCRKSLARKKLDRFSKYLENNLNSSTIDNNDPGYLTDESVEEESLEHINEKKQGFNYLRNLSKKFKINKKKCKKNHHNNTNNISLRIPKIYHLSSFSPFKLKK